MDRGSLQHEGAVKFVEFSLSGIHALTVDRSSVRIWGLDDGGLWSRESAGYWSHMCKLPPGGRTPVSHCETRRRCDLGRQ